MTSFELSQRISTFIHGSKVEYLEDALNHLVEYFVTLDSNSSRYIFDEDTSVQRQFVDRADELGRYIRTLSPRELNRNVDVLENAITELNIPNVSMMFLDIEDINRLGVTDSDLFLPAENLATIKRFWEAYENFIRMQSREAAVDFADTAYHLKGALASVRLAYAGLLRDLILDGVETVSEAETTMHVWLRRDSTAAEVALKVKAIADSYEQLSHLVDISVTEFPLRIARVEVGSLFLKLIGAVKSLSLLKELILKGVDYIYRTETTEGLLSEGIPKKLKGIRAAMDLESAMRDRGYETDEMRENINKAATNIAKDILVLSHGESQIAIDDSKVSIYDSVDEIKENAPAIPPLLTTNEPDAVPKELGPHPGAEGESD